MPSIKPITENDWNQFQVLELDTFPNDPLSKEDFLRLLSLDGFFGLFNNENILIGYLYCRIYNEYAHLHRIGVLSTERGKKYGSMLFEKAIAYFEDHSSPIFSLYVESHNSTAISLYKKYGLRIIFESWHFILHLNQHNSFQTSPYKDVEARDLSIDDLRIVQNIFSSSNVKELQGMLEDIKNKSNNNKFLALYDKSNLKAIARMNPKFSGCRPFFISDLTFFDTFINELLKFKEPDRTYIRITFDDNDELAKLCKERKYEIHHHLYKMTRKI